MFYCCITVGFVSGLVGQSQQLALVGEVELVGGDSMELDLEVGFGDFIFPNDLTCEIFFGQRNPLIIKISAFLL